MTYNYYPQHRCFKCGTVYLTLEAAANCCIQNQVNVITSNNTGQMTDDMRREIHSIHAALKQKIAEMDAEIEKLKRP